MRKKFILFLFFLFVSCTFASPQEKILLVEDAHYDYNNSVLGLYYTEALDANGLDYDVCEVKEQEDNGPGYNSTGSCGKDMKDYDIVIWFTGNDYGDPFDTLTSDDQENIEKYLIEGGKLFITGQDIGSDIGTTDFYEDYLNAFYCKNEVEDYILSGESTDPVGSGLLIDISRGAGNQERPSLIFYQEGNDYNNSFYYDFSNTQIWWAGKGQCKCGSENIYEYYCLYLGEYCTVCNYYQVLHSPNPFPSPGAIKTDTGGPNGYKVVYFAFGFEGIADVGEISDSGGNRIIVMNRIINYLSGPKTENTKFYVRNLDNTSWEYLNITCDPADNYCLRKINPKINSTCINNQVFGNITGAEFFVNSTGEGNGTNMSASDENFTSSTETVNGSVNVGGLDDGLYFVNVHCKDSDNYWGKFDNYSFVVDKIPPEFVSVGKPIIVEDDKIHTSKEKPKIEIAVKTGDYKPDYMQFSCNNQNWTDWVPYQETYFNFNITDPDYGCGSADGNRTIYVKIRDKAGNLGYFNTQLYASDSIILDRESPDITLLSPEDEAWVNSTNLTFVFKFTDELSSEANCSIYLDEILNQTNSSVLNNTNTEFSVSDLSESQHTWNITCTDLAGNFNFSERVFSVDISPPEITINNPEEGKTYAGIVDLLTEISDEGIGNISRAWYKIANTSNISQVFDEKNLSKDNNWDSTWNSSEVTNSTGNFTFIVYSNDTLGNFDLKNTSFKIDNTKPSAVIIFPKEEFINKNFNLFLKAEKPNGNITNAGYQVYNSSEIVANNTAFPNTPEFNFTDFLNISDWEDGNYTLVFNVSDSLNNNISETTWFFVDRTPPTLTNWNLNIENDTNYQDKRIYTGEEIIFYVNVYEEILEIDKVIATVFFPNTSAYNFSLASENSNYTFSFSPTQLGLYNITKIFANDTLGNLNETEINLSFKTVEPSIGLSFGENNKIDAGQNTIFNLSFYFNKTVLNQDLTLYIPNYYSNLTEWNCQNCSIINANETRIDLETLGSVINISLETNLLAGTTNQDLNSTWNLEFLGENYSEITKIKTPFLNISVLCNENQTCILNQKEEFNLTVIVENFQDENHTGKAYNVTLEFSCPEFSNSSVLGDINSTTNITKNWIEGFNESGNYTCTFNITDLTGNYTKILEKNIEIRDTEEPEFLGRSWLFVDNFTSNTTTRINKDFNRNESIEYFVKAKDNVEIKNVFIELFYNGNYTNDSLSLQDRYTNYDIWKFTDKLDELGIYNITKIYLNDTSGNLEVINLTDFFEIIELNLISFLTNESIEINKTQTLFANISKNASAILKVEAEILKPRNSLETLILNFENETSRNYLYKTTYSNLTRSGNYLVNTSVYLTSGVNLTKKTNFSVHYGNVSIKPSTNHLYLINGTTYNLTSFIFPENGDLINVSGRIEISGSIINLISGETQNKSFGNITWEDYNDIGLEIGWVINATELGNGTISIFVNSSFGESDVEDINVTVIENDTESPVIHNITDYPLLNLYETQIISINATDNNAIKNVTIEIIYPNNFSENLSASFTAEGLYKLDFNNTNETGNFSYNVFVYDLADNPANSTEQKFEVSDMFSSIIVTHNPYNKGNTVDFEVNVTNVQGKPVYRFNLTLILDKDGENTTLVNNTITNSGSYQIDVKDEPESNKEAENNATYTIYSIVEKNGNIGNSTDNFIVSEEIPTKIISPESQDYFPPSTNIPIEVEVKDKHGNLVSGAAVTAWCPASNEYKRLEWNSSRGTYYTEAALKSPSQDTFDIVVYSMDYWKNMGKYLVGLTTKESAGGDETGGGSTGTTGGGTTGLTNCTCTEWEDEGCGLANCSELEIYQSRVCDPAGCSAEMQCVYNPICKPEKDFKISIYPETLELNQGETKKSSIKIENIGETELNLIISSEKECCDLNYTETLKLEKKETKAVPISVHTKLSQKIGEYLIKFKVAGAEIEKEENLKIVVKESQYISYLSLIKEKLPKLKEEIKNHKTAGVDVASLEKEIQQIEILIGEANLSIASDDMDNLNKQTDEIKLKISYIESKLLSLKIEKFLLENKWNLIFTAIIILLITYLVTRVFYPYLKTSKEIKILRDKEQELINSRKETERKYFLRKMDEKAFRDILTRTQQKIFELNGEIKRRKDYKESIIKEKLAPVAFLIWVKSLPVSIFKHFKTPKPKLRSIRLKESKKTKIIHILNNSKLINKEVVVDGRVSFVRKSSEEEFLYKMRDETGDIYLLSKKELEQGMCLVKGAVKKSMTGRIYIIIKS